VASAIAVGGGSGEALAAERARILSTLLGRVDELADRAVATMRVEIPAYAAQPDDFFPDVVDQVARHYRTNLSSLLEERQPQPEDISFARGAAMRRARAGFALEDYINAFRLGQQVLWDAMLATAGDTALGHEAALSLTQPLMRFSNFASTHAGRAYVEFQQYAVADADRERRDLLELLLAGEMPPRGPLAAAARAYGLGQDTRMMVAAAVPVDASNGDTPHSASAALARAGLRQAKTLVVVRQAEIVAVPALGPGADPLELCACLEAVHDGLRREGLALAMGIGTVASGVAELPRAYREARAALQCVGDDGGVAALPRLSPFEYLALHADDTARRIVDPRVREFLDDDRARGGMLIATIRAFAEADMNLRVAAERLQIHPNTAQYRLGRIEERTGRNPRHVSHLVDLLVAIALDDAGIALG
jgi:hypothetical protein